MRENDSNYRILNTHFVCLEGEVKLIGGMKYRHSKHLKFYILFHRHGLSFQFTINTVLLKPFSPHSEIVGVMTSLHTATGMKKPTFNLIFRTCGRGVYFYLRYYRPERVIFGSTLFRGANFAENLVG